MTVIDVNSSKYTRGQFNQTILKTSLEAAPEIPRQLVKFIGGIILINFIDMKTGVTRLRCCRHWRNSCETKHTAECGITSWAWGDDS